MTFEEWIKNKNLSQDLYEKVEEVWHHQQEKIDELDRINKKLQSQIDEQEKSIWFYICEHIIDKFSFFWFVYIKASRQLYYNWIISRYYGFSSLEEFFKEPIFKSKITTRWYGKSISRPFSGEDLKK